MNKMLLAGLSLLLSPSLLAMPWLDTSDNYLRQSLQTLAQAGLLTGPVNTYPIMWKNIAIDLNKIDASKIAPELQFAVLHLKSALSANRQDHTSGIKLKLNSSEADSQSFGESYFERAAFSAFNEYQTDDLAGRLQINQRSLFTAQSDLGNEHNTTFDGSYLAAIMGNWVLALDQTSVWWGPGQQSSLLLSNNARPMPTVRLSRHSWQADERAWLNWLGPWSISTFVGQAEHSAAVPDTRHWGGRITIRPTPALELGASRVIQWGGQGYANGFSTLWDLISYDKRDEIQADQRAGLDVSYHFALAGWPLTAYAEIADDDNQSGFPDKTMQLFGLRSYLGQQDGIHTLNLEYSDTLLNCPDSLERGNCAYQGSLYPDGYRRYDRVIGSGYGADAKVLSAGYSYQTLNGISWSAHLYHANYYAGQRSDQSWQLKLEHRRGLFGGLLTLQLSALQKSPLRAELTHSLSAAGSWEYRF